MENQVKFFGIRHHGPGSSRSLLSALQNFQPDCLLVEGPPDAAELVSLAKGNGLQPPVSILIYNTENLKQSVYYPFAEYSPEWQALQFSLKQNLTFRFIDLPQKYQFIHESAEQGEDGDNPVDSVQFKQDPLEEVAKLTGDGDGELWWHRAIEENQSGQDVFSEVQELMTGLRNDLSLPNPEREEKREAYMRQQIRQAKADGFKNIAVVCGAWHVPALAQNLDQSPEQDQALLQKLKAASVACTWIPWTYKRLTLGGGYGAGVRYPGWYHHLWKNPKKYSVKWLVRISKLLRKNQLDASTAEVIDTVRVAETLSTIRGQKMPGLRELLDAAQATMLQGKTTKLKLIEEELLISNKIGQVPSTVPVIPLQKDIESQIQSLRLKQLTEGQELDLDLRKDLHLQRSHFLHRLELLQITWGRKTNQSNKQNTFHEGWSLRWKPELNLAIIDAGKYGNTLIEACQNKIAEDLQTGSNLEDLSNLLEMVILSNLSASVPQIIKTLQVRTVHNQDYFELMTVIPPLARLSRYGSVRSVDQESIKLILQEIIVRVSLGLPGSIHGLDYESAVDLKSSIIDINYWIRVLQDKTALDNWSWCLRTLSDQDSSQWLTNGLATRILLDAGEMQASQVSIMMNLALNTAVDGLQAASWLEGFLEGSSSLLLQDDDLWQILYTWLADLKEENFVDLLPFLRRAFARFEVAEKEFLFRKVKQTRATGHQPQPNESESPNLNPERAQLVLPVLEEYLQYE
jgi:hypothetical protein